MTVQPQTTVDVPVIRPLAPADRTQVLRLNADNRPAVAALNDAELTHLLEFGGYHLVAVDRDDTVLGYLLSFSRESAYDDSEINRLRQLLAEPFFYICQVVVANEYRRRRIGHAFYHAVMATARQRGVPTLCVDVNTDPPNPVSFAFHYRMGFADVGAGKTSDGTAVIFLAKKL